VPGCASEEGALRGRRVVGFLVGVIWTTEALIITPGSPHRKTDRRDPVTWPALIFRIVDDPSRTRCALALICLPLLAATLLLTDAGSPTLWVVGSGGILSDASVGAIGVPHIVAGDGLDSAPGVPLLTQPHEVALGHNVAAGTAIVGDG
jgi:hypothetical protein